VAPGEQNIFGLDVAVDDVVVMRVVESVCNFARNGYRNVNRQLVLALQSIPKSLSLDEWHREPHSSRGNSGIEDSKYVRVLKARGELDLALEPLRPHRFSDFRKENLERDVSIVPQIPGEVDKRESTMAELTLDRVVALEGRLQL